MIDPTAFISADIPVTPGQNITIPILLINSADFQAIDLELKYDANMLESPSSISTGNITQGWQIGFNDQKIGNLRISLSSINKNPKNTGTIAEITFTVKDNLQLEESSILDLVNVSLDEENIATIDGNIIVSNENLKPDLKATFFDTEIDHIIDGNTNVNFTILNQGLANSENFTINIYYSQDSNINPQEDTLLDSKNYQGLSQGEILEETLSINIPKNTLLNSAETDDLTGLGLNHVSENADYIGILINGENLTPEKGINIDDITFFPWDINEDQEITPSDIIHIINRLGQSVNENNNIRADLNLDNAITIEDINSVYNRLGYNINNTVFND